MEILYDSIEEFDDELSILLKNNTNFNKLNYEIIKLLKSEAKGVELYSYKINLNLFLSDFYTILLNNKKGV